MPTRRFRHRGYTLIEVLVTAAIVAILSALAYPSYTRHLLHSDRNAGKTALMGLAVRQESHYADRKAYATRLSALGESGEALYVHGDGRVDTDPVHAAYRLIIEPGATARRYALAAQPMNRQARDRDCGVLRLDSEGRRSASGALGAACWQG